MQFALIYNATSRRNKEGNERFEAYAGALLGKNFQKVGKDRPLEGIIADLRDRGVTLIAIDGGDGTVSHTLGMIARVYPEDALPEIVVFPSGNTNLIAADVGFENRGESALNELLHLSREDCRAVTRRPVRLSWQDGDREIRPPVLGMFGGGAGYERAIALAHSPSVLKYSSHSLSVLITMGLSLGVLLFRKIRRVWLRGSILFFVPEDGKRPTERYCSFFLISALERLMLGVWPFGERKPGQGFYYFRAAGFPGALGRAVWDIFRGRSLQWMHRPGSSYLIGQSKALKVVLDTPIVLDGEVYPNTMDVPLLIGEGPEFIFLKAAGNRETR